MDEAALTTLAAQHLRDILREAFAMKHDEQTIVIFDSQSPLSRILTEAYRHAAPDGQFIDFDASSADGLLATVDALKPGDMVVLVQTNNFRLNEFRFRIELFKRGLKTIEHTHLTRFEGDDIRTYIDALVYDPTYYRPLGHALKEKLDKATKVVVECDGTSLTYDGPLEETKLNIGDYSQMKNAGGLFPIGEVFTESRDLKSVNGNAMVFAFATDDHKVRNYEPFNVTVTNGVLTAPDAPQEFQAIIAAIKEDEEVLVRELGFGLNRAMGKGRVVPDINAFERQRGVHLSIGAKHAMYAKPGIGRKKGRYHVDIFIDVTKISINDEVVFEGGSFLTT